MIFTLETFDNQNSILLIGVGETNKYYLNIVRPETEEEVKTAFGDCDLTYCYSMLLDMGVNQNYIYVMNIDNTHDYLEAADLIRQYDFAYILPINLYISDYYNDPLNNGAQKYYVQAIMEKFYKRNNSYLLVTDKHASLYEDIDTYLNSMDSICSRIKNRQKEGIHSYENLVFVGNNLENIDWGNVYLAAMLSTTPIDEYPKYENNNYQNVIFDIDTHDVQSEVTYFKKHTTGEITIENLLSLDMALSPMKIVFIFRIQKYMFRDMDYTSVIGKPYTTYQMSIVKDMTIKYLNSYLGWLLQSFEIKDVFAKENTIHPGTVTIYIKFSIQPVGCVERYEVVKEIG